MRIAGLEKLSTVDYPGKPAAVIFTAGCNYRCFYCHNLAICGNPPLIDEEEVFRYLGKRIPLLEGVVITGGEPTLQEDLVHVMRRIRGLGLAVKLDTNGSRPEILEPLLTERLADYVAMDLKAPLPLYPKICGCTADGIAESMSLLAASEIPYEFRTTVWPGMTEDILFEMRGLLPAGSRWYLQKCRENGKCGDGAGGDELEKLTRLLTVPDLDIGLRG